MPALRVTKHPEAGPVVQAIRTETEAREIVAGLVGRSWWFDCTPYPDGLYAVRVKAENAAAFAEIVEAADNKWRCTRCGKQGTDGGRRDHYHTNGIGPCAGPLEDRCAT